MLLNTDDRPNILGVPEAWLDRANSGVEQLCRSMFNWFVANRGYYIIPINIPCTKKGKIVYASPILTNVIQVAK